MIAENGLVDLAMNEFEVVTTPRNIPDEIVIDITDMTMDSIVTVGDVPLPAGVEAVADAELPVVTVLTMRTPLLDEEDAAAAEAAEGLEGLEGEQAGEGEEAAAGESSGGDADD